MERGDFSRPFPGSAKVRPKGRVDVVTKIEQLFTKGGHVAREHRRGFERRLRAEGRHRALIDRRDFHEPLREFLAGVRVTSRILERFYPQPRVGRQRRGDDG